MALLMEPHLFCSKQIILHKVFINSALANIYSPSRERIKLKPHHRRIVILYNDGCVFLTMLYYVIQTSSLLT